MIRLELRRAGRAGARAFLDSARRNYALSATGGFEDAWVRVVNVPGWLTELNAAVFWGVVHDTRPKTVVEIGSYLGRSTVLLGLALKNFSAVEEDVQLVSIDPHTGDRQQLERLGATATPTLPLFRVHCESMGIASVLDVRVATSDEVAAGWDQPVDLLYVDGWHSYEAVRGDVENFARHLTPHGTLCCDDFLQYEDVRSGFLDACCELNLHVYGVVGGQAWAGVSGQPPPTVVRAIGLANFRPRRSKVTQLKSQDDLRTADRGRNSASRPHEGQQ